MIQAEGTKAIENIDAILNVDGIDVIFIGPYDLSASLGIIGQIEHPEICDTIQEIVQKADQGKGSRLGVLQTMWQWPKNGEAWVRFIVVPVIPTFF